MVLGFRRFWVSKGRRDHQVSELQVFLDQVHFPLVLWGKLDVSRIITTPTQPESYGSDPPVGGRQVGGEKGSKES